MYSVRSNNVSDITSKIATSDPQTQVNLLEKLSKLGSDVDDEQLEATLHALSVALTSEEVDVILKSISCISELLDQFSTDQKIETSKKLSLVICEMLESFACEIKECLEKDYLSEEYSALQPLYNTCRMCVQFFSKAIVSDTQLPQGFRLSEIHDLLLSVLKLTYSIFFHGSEWKILLNSRKYPGSILEAIRSEQSELFVETSGLLQKLVALLTNYELIPDSKQEISEIIFIYNQLLPICEISASWKELMDASWKGVNIITKKFAVQLAGQLDIDRLLKSLIFIIESKFKEVILKSQKPNSDAKQILPQSDQNAFLGSVQFVRFALVVLVSVCKSFVSEISLYEGVIEFTIGLRSQLPPAASSHSLGAAAIDVFTAFSPALETVYKVIISAPTVTDEFRWNFLKLLQIPDLYTLNSNDLNLSNNLHSLEKLQFLNSIISYSSNYSHDFLIQMTEAIHWIMNGLQLASSDVLFSINQKTRTSKTPLFYKTYMAIASFFIRLANENLFTYALPILIKYSFHRHFICNLMAIEIWYFITKHTSDYDSVISIIKQLLLICKELRIQHKMQLQLLLNKLIPIFPDFARQNLFRELLPNSSEMSNFDQYSFYLSVLPFNYASKTIQHTICTKIVKLFIQRCQEQITPTFINPQNIPLIAEIFQATHNIFKHEKLVSASKDHRIRLIELIFQLLPFPQVYLNPTLGPVIIQLAASLRHDFDEAQLLDFVDLLVQISQVTSIPKLSIIEFFKLSADVDISNKALLAQIFTKLMQLSTILLGDSDWVIRFAMLQALEQYSKFSVFDFRVIIPPDHVQSVIKFIEGESENSFVAEYEKLKEQQFIINQTFICSTPSSISSTPKTVDERLQQGFKLIKEGISLIDPVINVLGDNQINFVKEEIITARQLLDNMEQSVANPMDF